MVYSTTKEEKQARLLAYKGRLSKAVIGFLERHSIPRYQAARMFSLDRNNLYKVLSGTNGFSGYSFLSFLKAVNDKGELQQVLEEIWGQQIYSADLDSFSPLQWRDSFLSNIRKSRQIMGQKPLR